jgi:hypothetical protein
MALESSRARVRRAAASGTVLLLAFVTVAVSGCGVVNRVFRNTAAEERAAALLQLQLVVMRYADEYTSRVAQRVLAMQDADPDPRERLSAQFWLVSQANAAFTIAAGPNPELNAVDMLVFASLSRMVAEDRWGGREDDAPAAALVEAHVALEARAWDFTAEVLLTEAQIDELRAGIDAWRRENPKAGAVPFIHLADFAVAIRGMRPGSTSSGSIFSFLGLDPLRGLDPAVRELAQTRQLGERAVYYGQRVPTLVSMEAKRLALELAVMPESVQVLGGIDRIGTAAEAASALAADLPALVAAERAATIEQLTGVLEAREGRLQALMAELRAALEAGGTTSDSVRATVQSMDALVARFDRSTAPRHGPAPRPFDVTEYAEALRELGAAAEQLQALLATADRQAPALAQLPGEAAGRLTEVVDHLYWRLVQLVLVIAGACVLGALGYRALTTRWRRPPA